MILENDQLFFNAAAYDATSAIVDLGTTTPGKGKPICLFISAANDSAGVTAVVVTMGTVYNSAATACMTVSITSAMINKAGGAFFYLPSFCTRYVKLTLTGTSAGTNTAGVLAGTGQQNMQV